MARTSQDPTCLRLHEDDWRQVELVSRTYRRDVLANFDEVNRIRAEGGGFGFTRLHMRDEPRAPLRGVALARSDLEAAFLEASNRVAELTIRGRLVDDGWAYVGDSAAVYGVGSDEAIAVVGVHFTSQPASEDALVSAVSRLAETLDVWIVEWTDCRTYPDLDDA